MELCLDGKLVRRKRRQEKQRVASAATINSGKLIRWLCRALSKCRSSSFEARIQEASQADLRRGGGDGKQR